tara:strand:+ start:4033 stop:5280 length:1248 start_codon:yes stop_codon:yes gene_type:complete
MSSLLEEAIVDAKALKDAALKNAENLIVEKYSVEVKQAMDLILEQEDPTAAQKEEKELSKIAKQLPDAFSSTDDDAIIIDLDSLDSYINENLTINEKITQEAKEVIKGAHSMSAEIGVTDEEVATRSDMDTMMEDLMSEIDALYADDDETGAAPPVSDEPADVPPEEQTTGNAPATTAAADDGEELTPEETAYAEKLIQALGGAASASDDPTPAAPEADQEMVAESVKINAKPVPSGWNDTPEASMREYEELALALLQDTEIVEELENIAALKKKLMKENKALKTNAKKILEENNKLHEVVKYLREKIEDVNISNAKLLYINQTLESVSLNERQKQHIVEAITRADSVKEAKVIFETLQNSVGSVQKHKMPESLSESVTNRSSLLLAARQNNKKNEASSPFFDRMQKLAGLQTNN